MTDDKELIARLRSMHWCVTTKANGVGVSDGAVAREAADRIEALTAKLATCEKYRDAYAECDRIGTQAVRDLEAKLARAEWLLADAAVQLEEGKIKTRRNRAGLIWKFFDEIKGT